MKLEEKDLKNRRRTEVENLPNRKFKKLLAIDCDKIFTLIPCKNEKDINFLPIICKKMFAKSVKTINLNLQKNYAQKKLKIFKIKNFETF